MYSLRNKHVINTPGVNMNTETERLNVELGKPYIIIIENAIKKGYAGNKSEVIRQALKAYDREINAEEEAMLVKKGVEEMMGKINEGKIKTRPLEEIEKKYNMH